MGKEKWRLINDPPLSGKINMDRDLQIMLEVAEGKAPPTLRLYRWSPPALSLGFSQKEEKVADLEACRRLNIDIVRRPTGGRAVLHHRELTYSIVIPENHTLIPKGILPSYKFLSRALITALDLLDIGASLAAGEKKGQKPIPGACFDSSSAYEIQVGGKKVVGSAQLRRNGVLLQHGSILLELAAELYFQVLKKTSRGTKASLFIEALGKKAAGLLDLGCRLNEKDLEQSLVAGFSQILGAEFIEEDFI